MRLLIALAGTAAIAGCASTDPRGAADIRYHLPRTDAKVAATLTLTNCDESQMKIRTVLSVSAVKGAQADEVVIAGTSLSSSRIYRKLKIEVDDNLVITSINTTNTDKTAQIIGNYIQGIASIAGKVIGAGLRGTPALPMCNDETMIALKRAKAIQAEVNRIRDADSSGKRSDSVKSEDRWKTLEALANEFASLQPLLALDTSASLRIDKTLPTPDKPAKVMLDSRPLARWLQDPSEVTNDNLRLAWWAVLENVPPISVPKAPPKSSSRECRLAAPTPSPKTVSVHVRGDVVAIPEASASFPAAQLGDPTALCLDVGFGESRVISLTFDAFGRTRSYDWTSDATQETISKAFLDSSGAVGTLIQKARGPTDLERTQAEIDQLDAEQKLATLRACKAKRELGLAC